MHLSSIQPEPGRPSQPPQPLYPSSRASAPPFPKRYATTCPPASGPHAFPLNQRCPRNFQPCLRALLPSHPLSVPNPQLLPPHGCSHPPTRLRANFHSEGAPAPGPYHQVQSSRRQTVLGHQGRGLGLNSEDPEGCEEGSSSTGVGKCVMNYGSPREHVLGSRPRT